MVVPTTACARDRAEASEPRLSIHVPADTEDHRDVAVRAGPYGNAPMPAAPSL